MEGPLEGIRVLDFGQAAACPVIGWVLAGLGADVIKIEKLEGEAMRWGLSPEGVHWSREPKKEDPTEWMSFNPGKRALAINLKQDKGKEIITKLIHTTDVLIHNSRPGVMARLGLDYKSVSQINPMIVYLNVYGYGEEGPLVHKVSGDSWIQALSGIVSLQGTPNGGPYLAGPCVVDHITAMSGVAGVLAALVAREKIGSGQEIVTSLLNGAIFLQHVELNDYLIDGKLQKKVGRGWRGAFPYGPYKAKDGDVSTFHGAGPDWKAFCQVLGLTHLLNNPRYETQELREVYKEELYPILDEAFSKKTRDEWHEEFEKAGLRVEPALDYVELLAHPQFEANCMLDEVDHPKRGKIKMVTIPTKLRKTPGGLRRAAPLLGQHTKEILGEIGYSAEEVTELTQAGVVRVSEVSPRSR